MLKRGRIAVGWLFVAIATLLFLDFTGSIHTWMGWVAKVQFVPALLAMNLGVVVGIVLLTLLFGRIYCSTICPLGVLQDGVSHIGGQFQKRRFGYVSAIGWLRWGLLLLFVVCVAVGGAVVVSLLEPYGTFGLIVSNLLSPLWQWGNNLLAYFAMQAGSYAFYGVDVWMKGAGGLVTAVLLLGVVSVMSWRKGRLYCNTICPVGTLLGFFARYSLFRYHIDKDKCNGCGLCAAHCKAQCIDTKGHRVDHSRCVSCFNCLDVCKKGALSYGIPKGKPSPPKGVNVSRRNMLSSSVMVLSATTLKAQQKRVDGGLAIIEEKKIQERSVSVVPPGAESIRRFRHRCTGCQLCVSVCPSQVLRPSAHLNSFMQPELSFERGYCRPECTKCSEVCPTGAIGNITTADKSAIQVGRAVWVEQNCVALTDNVDCDNCFRHCPTGAIKMIDQLSAKVGSPMIPTIDTEHCIGCGACENLCPARPFGGIYVEGNQIHRTV